MKYAKCYTIPGFTLVEILIVVAIIGILAAVVIPTFQDQTQAAKEAAAKDNLRVLRNAIELYTTQHNDTPPGYFGAITSYNVLQIQLTQQTNALGQFTQPGTAGYDYGPYMKELPQNPFNGIEWFTMISDGASFPAEATGTSGWIYKPATKEIRLDWPGTDKDSIRYYDY